MGLQDITRETEDKKSIYMKQMRTFAIKNGQNGFLCGFTRCHVKTVRVVPYQEVRTDTRSLTLQTQGENQSNVCNDTQLV